jgi:general stress protein 26
VSDPVHDYEKVSIYFLDPAVQEELLASQRECVFNWSTRDGWPMGVIMSCLWKDGRMWLTAGANRHRISAVRRNPRCSVVVTSTGTPLGPGKTVTIKGRATIHEDRETKDWFYPAFASHLHPDPAQAEAFCRMLDSPMRVVIEIEPVKFITYDGVKMFKHAAGQLSQDELGPPKESDTERFERELARRGLRPA